MGNWRFCALTEVDFPPGGSKSRWDRGPGGLGSVIPVRDTPGLQCVCARVCVTAGPSSSEVVCECAPARACERRGRSCCASSSSGGIYAPADACVRVRLRVRGSRLGSDETELSRAVHGSALQDRVLPAGGQPDRVGGSGEVPGPEADRNWSLRNRVVRTKLTFNQQMDKCKRKGVKMSFLCVLSSLSVLFFLKKKCVTKVSIH